jgi:hypothetical protein
MNSVQSFDDGMGSTMENGVITCNSFSTDNFTATTLNSTTGNITTLNTNTANIETINSSTINNTGNTTTQNLVMKNGGFSYIGDISTYSEQFINTTTNIYRYILYPPINKLLYTINGNNTLELTDTTATITGTLNTTTISNSGTTTTGTLASTTINNTGTTTTGTLASTTINNTGTTTTGTLASTTINNTGTTTSNILTATTSGTIPTFNSTTINNTGTISSNILNTSTANISSINCSSIQPINTASSFNLLTTSTGDINIGGSGNICLNKNGNYALKTKTTPATNYAQIDFKSSNSTNTYDTQIVSAGGTAGTDGLGTLILKGNVIRLNGQVAFTDFITTQTVGGKSLNTTYQNFKTSPIFISVSATNGTSSVLTAKTNSATPPTTQVAYTTLFNNVGQTIFFIVLPNNYYRVETSAGGTLQLWTEWG